MKSILPIILFLIFFLPRGINGNTGSDTTSLNRFIKSGFKSLSLTGRSSEAKAYIDSAVSLCKRENKEMPAGLNLLKARWAFLMADYHQASDLAEAAITKAVEEGDHLVHCLTLSFFGSFYFRTGSFQESLDYFDRSISMATQNGIRGIIPGSLYGKAGVFGALDDYEGNRIHLVRMIDASKSENDTSHLIEGLYLLGSLHSERIRNFTLSDSLLRECYALSSARGDIVHMALSQANMGWNYYLAEMYDSSVACYNRSLKISVPEGIITTAANAYGNLGTIYRDMNNTEKAIELYNKSIELALKAEDWYSLQWVYKDMSDLYLKRSDTANAFNAFVLHKKYNDQFFIKSNAQGLSDAKLRYDTDSHRKEIQLLSLKIKNQKLMIYGFTGISLLIIFLFVLLYRGSKLKAKRSISEMNRTISELTQANLRQQMNPHFIFNTLNSIQYYMYQHDKLATNNYMTKFTSLMRKVLENSQHTSVPIKDELEALNLYLELESLRFKDRFEYTISVDEEIDPLLFRIPTMLIQPYVENSVCHGMIPRDIKGKLSISLILENDHIICTIEDNGIGREAARIRKSTQGSNHNSLGTRIVESRLDLVNKLYGTSLKTVYTDLKSVNGEPAGTKVEIHIPIIA